MAQETIVGPPNASLLACFKSIFLNDAVIFKHNVSLQRQEKLLELCDGKI